MSHPGEAVDAELIHRVLGLPLRSEVKAVLGSLLEKDLKTCSTGKPCLLFQVLEPHSLLPWRLLWPCNFTKERTNLVGQGQGFISLVWWPRVYCLGLIVCVKCRVPRAGDPTGLLR